MNCPIYSNDIVGINNKNLNFMGDRKGILTPEQEKTLDRVVEFNNKWAEAGDGSVIRLVDNQVLERLKGRLEKVAPNALPIVYDIVDTLFEEVLDKIMVED